MNGNDAKSNANQKAAKKQSKKKKKTSKPQIIPQEYLCPITKLLMTDPVIAADGRSYERAAITLWLATGHTKSPVKNTPLAHTNLVANDNLLGVIKKFKSMLPKKQQKEQSVTVDLQAAIRERELSLLESVEEKKESKQESKESIALVNEQKVVAVQKDDPTKIQMQQQIDQLQSQIQELTQRANSNSNYSMSSLSASVLSSVQQPALTASSMLSSSSTSIVNLEVAQNLAVVVKQPSVKLIQLSDPNSLMPKLVNNKYLNHALRHNTAIALIYKFFDTKETVSNQLLSECIRHFALLYHMFRHLVALKLYQNIKDEETIVDLRNMIRHGGWHAKREDVVKTAKLFAERNRIAEIYHKNQYHKVLITEFEDNQLQIITEIFQLQEAKQNSPVASLDFTKTPLYEVLATYFDELKQADDLQNDAEDFAINQFIVIINAIFHDLPPIEDGEGHSLGEIRETHALHFDALKMLVSMCAELRGYLLGKNHKTKNANLAKFISYCAQGYNSIGGRIGHVFPDFDYANNQDIEELMKVGQLALAVNANYDLSTTNFDKSNAGEEKKVMPQVQNQSSVVPVVNLGFFSSSIMTSSSMSSVACLEIPSALSSSIGTVLASQAIEGLSQVQVDSKEVKAAVKEEEEPGSGAIWEARTKKEFSERVYNAAIAAVQTADSILMITPKKMVWENIYKAAAALKSNIKVAAMEIFNAFCTASEAKLTDACYKQFAKGNEQAMSKIYFLRNYPAVINFDVLCTALQSSNCNIAYLDLFENAINSRSMKILAKLLKNNTKLTGLSLRSNQLGDEGLSLLAEILPTTNILYLNLESNGISAAGIKPLVQILPTTKLLSLNLGSNAIRNEGVVLLSEVLTNTVLKKLNLWNTNVGANGVKALAKILAQTHIEHLNLLANGIGKTGPDFLKTALKTMRTQGKSISIVADNLSEEQVAPTSEIAVSDDKKEASENHASQVSLSSAKSVGFFSAATQSSSSPSEGKAEQLSHKI